MVNCWLGWPVHRPGPWLAAVSYLQCDWWRLDRERRPRWPRMELHLGLTLNNAVTGPGMGKLIQDLLCSKVQSPQNWLLSLMTFSLRSKIGLLLTTILDGLWNSCSSMRSSLWHDTATPHLSPGVFFIYDLWPGHRRSWGGALAPLWQKYLAWQNRIGWLGRKEIDTLAEKNWRA